MNAELGWPQQPYRITNVDAAQGPVQRLVGAGQDGIHTAGYAGQMGGELTIDGVADFEAIKDQILEKVRQRPPEATESGEQVTATTPETAGESRHTRSSSNCVAFVS